LSIILDVSDNMMTFDG